MMKELQSMMKNVTNLQETLTQRKDQKTKYARDYRKKTKTTTQQTCVDFLDDPWTYNPDCGEEKIETVEWNHEASRRFCGTLTQGTILVGRGSGDVESQPEANYANFRHMKDIVFRTLKLPENQNCYYKGGVFYVALYNEKRHTWIQISQKDFCKRFRELVWEIWCEYLEYNYKNVYSLTRGNRVQRCCWTNKNIETFFGDFLSPLTEPTRKLKGYYIKANSSIE